MNDIVWTKSYEDYKTEVGQELTRASESFVRIGYLLKAARDTEVLKDSEYGIGNYIQFAEKEFGLEKTQVSRFIRINDRFSEGGNSDVLREEYRGYGTRKLGIMLTLPDELTEELSPDYTVEEMETIQQEVKEEQALTPIEQYAEELEAERTKAPAAELAKDDILGAALYQIMEDRPELYTELDGCKLEDFREILSPVEDTMYICRVQGVGKLLLTCKEEKLSIVNARTNEKQFFDWTDAQDAFLYITERGCGGSAKENWEAIYGKPYPIEEKVKEKPKNDNFGSKNEKNAQKKAEKTKNEKKRVNVTKEKKNAEKERKQETETEGHESAGNGTEERTEQIKDLAAEQGVHDLQPEGSAGESQLSGEKNLGGTEGESLSLGTGEALSGEDSGTAGGEGNAAGTVGRNKYSGRLEQLTWSVGTLIKDINGKDSGGITAANWIENAMKEAVLIRDCIQEIIKELEKEEKPAWREVE